MPGGAGAQRGRLFVQKALLAELVPRCSIEPRSSRAGPSCACLPAVPVRQPACRSPALSCRIKRGAVHRCGHGCCAGTRALAHCNPALPLPRTTSTHGHALCADLEERVLARRGTSAWRTIFPWKMRLSGCVRQNFPKIAPGGARGDSFVRCHVKVIRLFRNFTPRLAGLSPCFGKQGSRASSGRVSSSKSS